MYVKYVDVDIHAIGVRCYIHDMYDRYVMYDMHDSHDMYAMYDMYDDVGMYDMYDMYVATDR